MDKRNVLRISLLILLAIFLSACVSGQQQYDVAMQLSQAGKDKEAMAYLEQALANAPNNKTYQQALVDLKQKLIGQYVGHASKILSEASPLTLAALNDAKAQLAEAQAIDASDAQVVTLKNKLDAAEKDFLAEIQTLYDEAKQSIAMQDWLKAYFNLQQIQSRFPNYEDSFQQMLTVADQGATAYYTKASAQMAEDDIQGAIDNLRQGLSINPDHGLSLDLMAQARRRDNKTYFITKAKNLLNAKKWDKAIKAYRQALSYTPNDQNLKQLIAQIDAKAGAFYVQKAREQMMAGWLFNAFESYQLAVNYAPKKTSSTLMSVRADLCTRANYAAESFKEQQKFGSAWYWYKKISKINPDYPKIFYLAQAMEDEIKARVRKSIAVFDFSSPAGFPDAGIIVANNLITYLFEAASGDIKILERENLKSILEEMQLGQIGVVSSDSAKEMGRVYGIDVAIMGSVLLFKVDATSSEGIKTVRYKTGTKIEDNIEFLNWQAKNPSPSKEQLAQAPPAKITAPQFAEKDYKVSKHKKIGFVQLSFRIVDVSTGENIQVKTIERKEVVEDEGSAGLPEANVKYDPVDIPSDTELLQKMTEEVVTELGREALRPLQNLEKKYFEKGQQHLRRRDGIQAAEGFVNSIFNEKMKMIHSSPLSEKATENLDDIFRKYHLRLEG